MNSTVPSSASSLLRCNAAITESFEWNGLHIRDLTAAFGSRSSFAVIDVIPMAKHPLSCSSRCEKYYYVLSGQLHFHCGGVDTVLCRQDLIVVPPDIRFAYANRSNRLVQLLLVHTPVYAPEHEVVCGECYGKMNIYHVTDNPAWNKGLHMAGSYAPPSLEKEGFIHFCDHAMVGQTADYYFPDAEEVTVTEVNPSLVAPQLRYEKTHDTDEYYPHLYGALNMNAVVRTVPIQRKNGSFDCSDV